MKYLCPSVRASLLAVVLVLVAGIGAETAFAAVAVVGGSCATGVTFSTIQAAINAVPAGSTVKVCPGTYPEQLTINKKLTLQGVASGNSNAVVIAVPSGGVSTNGVTRFNGSPTAAQIYVTGPATATSDSTHVTVNISNVIVDGAGNGISGCSPDFIGIYYADASGTLNHVTARNQMLSAGLAGCQTGLAIFAESSGTPPAASSLLVENSSVHDFQKNGITAHTPGTSMTVTNNSVIGQGPTNQIAQNGIEIAFGAAGAVIGNTVVDYVYTGAANASSTGILYFNAAPSGRITGNQVDSTQGGIVLVSDSTDYTGLEYATDDSESVTLNQIRNSLGTFGDGIDACSNNNTIKSNSIFKSDDSGIHLDDECSSTDGSTGNNNTTTGNNIVDACVGILLGTGTNSPSGNTFFDVTTQTLAADSCPSPVAATAQAQALKSFTIKGRSYAKYSPVRP
jgi:hypothetical protein